MSATIADNRHDNDFYFKQKTKGIKSFKKIHTQILYENMFIETNRQA